MYREIAGHEWWGADGKHIYFDLQKPRGETFFVGKVNVYTGVEEDFELQRHEWSVHFVSSWDEQTLAGDGGSKTSVAHSPEGQWIYFFEYDGNRLKSTKLVNMKNHNYNLEPNIHYSPDQKWIIFRANFEGSENVYAVELSPYTPNI
jgi:oligogalacturonide lyase